MDAVVIESNRGGFALREVETPAPPLGWARVRVQAVGICGSDLPIFDGIRNVPTPFIPGHETVGTIDALNVGAGAALGADGTPLALGDAVAVNMVIACHTCPHCRNQRPTLCDTLTELGIHINGGFAEYVIAPIENLHPLPHGLNFAQATAVDPLASVYHGLKLMPVYPDDTVAVLGTGPMGLYALQLARLAGARRVIAVGRNHATLKFAHANGADEAVSIAQTSDLPAALSRLNALTGGRGPSLVVEATGAPSMLTGAVEMAARGGRVMVLGVFHEPAAIYPGPIVRKELQIMGSLCYTPSEYADCLGLLAQGRIAPIDYRALPLRDMQHGLDLFRGRHTAKVVMLP